ncbi:hypothetical protein OROGR_007147 [Orobanche gracilis]
MALEKIKVDNPIVEMDEKENVIASLEKLLSERQDLLSLLERDLARTRTELNERESKITEISKNEASLKSDFEKVKRMSVQARRTTNNLQKEKEDLSKEIQALSKQFEEARQTNRNTIDSVSEQALREKVKEKETKIQLLERTLERHREDLKKEKEDHIKEKDKSLKIRETILESREIVTQQRTTLTDELKKHKQALRTLQDEVDKLKISESNPSESTTCTLQNFSNTILKDFASAYFQAVKNFEQAAQPASGGVDSAPSDAPPPDNNASSSAGTLLAQTIAEPHAPPTISNVPLTKVNEEKEKRLSQAKANIKFGRKLVRPSITKPKEPQGDVDMSEADESNTTGQNAESQMNAPPQLTAIGRKRPSVSSSSDLQEEMLVTEETSTDVPTPLLKKSKPSEVQQEDGDEPSTDPIEESPDDVAVNKDDEPVDTEKDEAERDESEAAGEQLEEVKVDQQIPVELPSDTGDEDLDKPSETVLSDDKVNDQTEQDIPHIITESGEGEEVEVAGDFGDNNDGYSNLSSEVTPVGIGEFQGYQSMEPDNSPGLEVVEIDEEKNDEENELDKFAESDQAPESSAEDASASSGVDVGPVLLPEAGGKPVSPVTSSSRTINLQERARARAQMRLHGVVGASPSGARGRGVLGRGVRGGRAGRGQSPG